MTKGGEGMSEERTFDVACDVEEVHSQECES